MQWIRVGTEGEFAEGRGRTLRLRGRRIAIFRYEQRIHAIDAVCPHSGADLGRGRVHRGRVTCPDHGWTFDLSTGCMPDMEEISVRTFRVKVEGESVFLSLPSAEESSTRRRVSGETALAREDGNGR